jgi:hypothetical protein
MVMTVHQSIPVNSRGFFLRERDSLRDQYGVQLKFPRGREFMHGENQTMLMIGLQSKINSMLPKVRTILDEAHDQYLGYKERQTRRRVSKIHNGPSEPDPLKKKSKEVAKKPANLFSSLEGLDEQESFEGKKAYEKHLEDQKMEDAISQGLVPRPNKVVVSTMDFAKAASKPAEPNPIAHFDWAEDVDDGNTWVPGTDWGDV